VKKIQTFVQPNNPDKNFGLDFNCKDAIDLELNFSNFSISSGVLNGNSDLP
jgi:hypothetical protein